MKWDWDKHGYENLSQGQNPNGAKGEPKGVKVQAKAILGDCAPVFKLAPRQRHTCKLKPEQSIRVSEFW